MSGTVIVVPAGRDRDLWLSRVGTVALQRGMSVAAVVASSGRGDTLARDAINDLIATGVVDSILVAFRDHLPDQWPAITEASASSDTRPTRRRPTPVDRAEPAPVEDRPHVLPREA